MRPDTHYASLPKLLLSDGTSIVRRVYEAVKGEHTAARAEGALNSSWASFMRALREHEPTHFLAAFDFGGETWRHRLYPQYKAHRDPMPSCLADALPGFLERMNNSGMHTLRLPDVEADDTLATLALKAVARGFEVVLLTTDKDMYRLIDSGVKVYDHFQSEWRDEAWVRERFGVSPALMTDFLALMGDDSDGIPGVDKVGVKTAAKLLNEHGSLNAVLDHAGDISGVVGERIRSSADIALLSRELATLKCDVALGISPRDIQLPAALVAHIQTMPEPRMVRTNPMSAAPTPRRAAHVHGTQEPAPAARRLRM